MLDFLVTKAYAQGAGLNLPVPGPIIPVTGVTDLGTLIQNVLNTLLIIAGALAVIYLIIAGVQYITAGGDATKATAARTAIVNAIIGIVIILLAYAIVNWVVKAVSFGQP